MQTMYTAELAETICDRLASGESLRAICRDDGMPSEALVRRWALDDHEGFFAQYTRAREIQAHVLAEEVRIISDTPMIGRKVKMSADGVEVTEGDMTEHRRLQMDARKWYLSKVLPKVYGDKLTTELSGPNGGPIAVTMTDAQLAAIAAQGAGK